MIYFLLLLYNKQQKVQKKRFDKVFKLRKQQLKIYYTLNEKTKNMRYNFNTLGIGYQPFQVRGTAEIRRLNL